MKLRIIVLILLTYFTTIQYVFSQLASFKQDQMRYPRFRTALAEKDSLVREMFEERRISYPPEKIFIRIFKEEMAVELWAQSCGIDTFSLVKVYDICDLSGILGPKRQIGDYQTPEGFYYVDRFNPYSNFYLSLGINYPNQSDNILKTGNHPGRDIFIHGSCVTIGCIPITDEKIKELYLICVETKSNGQENMHVHIFPKKMDDSGFDDLRNRFVNNSSLILFWENLKEFYDIFENTHKLPSITVDNQNGRYLFIN